MEKLDEHTERPDSDFHLPVAYAVALPLTVLSVCAAAAVVQLSFSDDGAARALWLMRVGCMLAVCAAVAGVPVGGLVASRHRKDRTGWFLIREAFVMPVGLLVAVPAGFVVAFVLRIASAAVPAISGTTAGTVGGVTAGLGMIVMSWLLAFGSEGYRPMKVRVPMFVAVYAKFNNISYREASKRLMKMEAMKHESDLELMWVDYRVECVAEDDPYPDPAKLSRLLRNQYQSCVDPKWSITGFYVDERGRLHDRWLQSRDEVYAIMSRGNADWPSVGGTSSSDSSYGSSSSYDASDSGYGSDDDGESSSAFSPTGGTEQNGPFGSYTVGSDGSHWTTRQGLLNTYHDDGQGHSYREGSTLFGERTFTDDDSGDEWVEHEGNPFTGGAYRENKRTGERQYKTVDMFGNVVWRDQG